MRKRTWSQSQGKSALVWMSTCGSDTVRVAQSMRKTGEWSVIIATVHSWRVCKKTRRRGRLLDERDSRTTKDISRVKGKLERIILKRSTEVYQIQMNLSRQKCDDHLQEIWLGEIYHKILLLRTPSPGAVFGRRLSSKNGWCRFRICSFLFVRSVVRRRRSAWIGQIGCNSERGSRMYVSRIQELELRFPDIGPISHGYDVFLLSRNHHKIASSWQRNLSQTHDFLILNYISIKRDTNRKINKKSSNKKKKEKTNLKTTKIPHQKKKTGKYWWTIGLFSVVEVRFSELNRRNTERSHKKKYKEKQENVKTNKVGRQKDSKRKRNSKHIRKNVYMNGSIFSSRNSVLRKKSKGEKNTSNHSSTLLAE